MIGFFIVDEDKKLTLLHAKTRLIHSSLDEEILVIVRRDSGRKCTWCIPCWSLQTSSGAAGLENLGGSVMLVFTQSEVCNISIVDRGTLKFYVENKVPAEVTFMIRQYRSRRGTGNPQEWQLILDQDQRGSVPLPTNIELVEIWTEGEFVLSCITRGKEIVSARLTPIVKQKPAPRAEVELPLPKAIADDIRTLSLPSRIKA